MLAMIGPNLLRLHTPPSISTNTVCYTPWLAPRATLASSPPPLIGRGTLVHGCLASASSAILLSTTMPVPTSLASDNVDDDTQDWYRFEGDGFALSVPPDFEDIREPEDYVEGALYGNKAKPKTFVARFASSDRSEVLSVLIRQSSQLKLTFLAVKDVTDLGSLRDAANIFVPVGAKLYAARTIKTSDEDLNRTYYYYEFATGDNYVAIEAGASSGKVFVLGVTAPKSKWKDDSRKLRLVATSFSLL